MDQSILQSGRVPLILLAQHSVLFVNPAMYVCGVDREHERGGQDGRRNCNKEILRGECSIGNHQLLARTQATVKMLRANDMLPATQVGVMPATACAHVDRTRG